MEHLEWHPHAFIDDNNVVLSVAVFDGSAHDTELIEDARKANGWKQAICCCTFGIANVGDTWLGDKFRPAQPYPSWIWNDTLKVWDPPIPNPKDSIYSWNEQIGNWEKLI